MKKFNFFILFFLSSFFAFSQGSYTFNWVATTVSPGNNLQNMNILKDNSALVVGLKGTFKKSTDMGLTWKDVPVLKGVYDFNDLSIDANGVGYACSRRAKSVDYPYHGKPDVYVPGALLKTTDYGKSWTLLNPAVVGTGDDPAINPNVPGCYAPSYSAVESVNDTVAYVGVDWYDINSGKKALHSAVFKTSDGGASWKAITGDYGYHYAMAIEATDSTVFIGGNKVLLKTNIESDTISDIYPKLAAANKDSSIFIFDFTIVNKNEIYVTTSSDGIFKTEDCGDSFTKLAGPTGGYDFCKVNDSTFLVLGTSTKSKLSTDGGKTWVSFYPGASCYEIGGILNDSLYGLGRSDIYKVALSDLATHTNTWTTTMLSDGHNLQKMAVVGANSAIIVGYGDTFKTTDDKGATWKDANLPELYKYGAKYDFQDISTHNGASYVCARRYKEIDYPYSSGKSDIYIDGLIYKSFDNWKTWKLLDISKIGSGNDPSANPQVEGCYSMDPFAIECVDSSTAFVYIDWNDTTSGKKVYHGRVFRTTDGGDSWDTVTKDFGYHYVTDIKFVNDSTGFILGNKIFLKTTDGGNTWSDLYPILTVGTDSSLYIKSITYINSSEFFITTVSDGIFKTTDGGATYQTINGKTGANAFYVLDSTTYMTAGSKTKTLFTHDKGKTWVNCTPGVTLWNFGGVLNDSLVALARSDIYKIALSDLIHTTGIRGIRSDNPLKIYYKPNSIAVYSPGRAIDRCLVYSMGGRLLETIKPASKTCVINYRSYAPGIYIIASEVAGKRYVNKVIFR